MSREKEFEDVLEFILRRATDFELEMVGEALKRRGRDSGLGRLDINNMARTMAEGIEKQMGVGEGQMRRMSRQLVADMIRKEKPGISPADLEMLLDQFLPGAGERSAPRCAIPKDMLLAMVTQFVSYSTGQMKEQEKRQFPEGWLKKYWDAFPAGIQRDIKEYVNGAIGKNDFWRRIREAFALIK